MNRCLLIPLLSLLPLSPVQASLGHKTPYSVTTPLSMKTIVASADSGKDAYRITPVTEVLLDGRPCRYEQVPNNAIIILLEIVSNESTEISRIHFRTSRRPVSPVTSK